ncbi:RNA-binding protein [Chloropicon primus]|uniref:RNA-binding protein n=1 Tax=Chloropicon primus TaxID=1764295 RepID=A0A5B8MQR5_9CHLO|nr:RNA-binding protein [Chloropicon primus]UPR02103.1 RNA-binding protein [Chloropicon primus]|eukprot:QDZ22879.1 RNA-binding protein [Chloropicon primus]
MKSPSGTYAVFVTGIHEEAEDEDLFEAFSEYGNVVNMALNVDRRTGYAKGYALLEFSSRDEAAEAIEGMNETELLGKVLGVSWAFRNRPIKG